MPTFVPLGYVSIALGSSMGWLKYMVVSERTRPSAICLSGGAFGLRGNEGANGAATTAAVLLVGSGAACDAGCAATPDGELGAGPRVSFQAPFSFISGIGFWSPFTIDPSLKVTSAVTTAPSPRISSFTITTFAMDPFFVIWSQIPLIPPAPCPRSLLTETFLAP